MGSTCLTVDREESGSRPDPRRLGIVADTEVLSLSRKGLPSLYNTVGRVVLCTGEA